MVTLELENTVTENMSEIELNSLHSNISMTYGIKEDKLEMNINYQTKGSIYLYPSMYDAEIILEHVKNSISVTLNIPTMSIEVLFNDADFIVYYSIASNTYEKSLEISGLIVDTCPKIILPVDPSIVIISPSLIIKLEVLKVFVS